MKPNGENPRRRRGEPRTPLTPQQIALVHAHLEKARILHAGFAKRVPWIDRDDLLGAAQEGLMQAVKNYDPSQGKFSTHAEHRINGAMYDLVRQMSPLSRNTQDLITRIRKMEADTGARVEGDEVVANKLHVTQRALAAALRLQSLRSIPINHTDVTTGGSMTVAVDGKTQEEMVIEKEEIDRMMRAIEYLPEKQKTVVRKYFFEGVSLEEIGKGLEVTDARIFQIKKAALENLHTILATQDLKPVAVVPDKIVP